jgi:hypothetical protein
MIEFILDLFAQGYDYRLKNKVSSHIADLNAHKEGDN